MEKHPIDAEGLRLQPPQREERAALKQRIIAATSGAAAAPTLRPEAKDEWKALAHPAYLQADTRRQLPAERMAALKRIPQQPNRRGVLRRLVLTAAAAACFIAAGTWWLLAENAARPSERSVALEPIPAKQVGAFAWERADLALKTSQTVLPEPAAAPVRALPALDPLARVEVQPVQPPAAAAAELHVILPPEVHVAHASANDFSKYAPPSTPLRSAVENTGQRLLVRTRGRFGWELTPHSPVAKFRLHAGRFHWTAAR